MLFNADEIAQVTYAGNRALQQLTGDVVSPEWDDAPDWQRDSSVAGVHVALNGAAPEELHAAWCDHKSADGWTYGPAKDTELKTHPCLVPYAELPRAQRAKDVVFNAIVKALADC